MDNKFLDKVVDQIVRETTIDYENDIIFTPFAPTLPLPPSPPSHLLFISNLHPSFIIHCREVYGLNKEEIGYVWYEYRKIIKDKIYNGL